MGRRILICLTVCPTREGARAEIPSDDENLALAERAATLLSRSRSACVALAETSGRKE